MIAIGGAIGTGLFLGSGFAISLAGPAVIISYVIGGIIALLMMTALSEMAVAQPTAGSFGVYAEQYVSPWAGFVLRYSYWIGVVIAVGTEVTATGIYMQRWFPEVPSIVWIILFAGILFLVNSTSVGNFGKFEFWFASIKVAAIVAFIVIGCIVVFGPAGEQAGFTFNNYTNDRGFAPFGVSGILLGSFIAIFSYLSMEMIAVTAGEAKDPEKAVPRALKSAMLRLFLFYIFSIGIMLAMVPWGQAGATESPFVSAFSLVGIPYAADIMNFVVLTAALSSCNSGIFSTARMLFDLASHGEAPKRFGNVTKSGVPGIAIIASAFCLIVGVLLNYVVPAKVFTWVTSIATFGAIWTWAVILLSQMRFRRSLKPKEAKNLKYRMPLFPISSYVSLAFLVFVVVVMGFSADTRIALYIGPSWIILLVAIYYGKGLHKRNVIPNAEKKVQAR
jgi:AAT family amino acid transporter